MYELTRQQGVMKFIMVRIGHGGKPTIAFVVIKLVYIAAVGPLPVQQYQEKQNGGSALANGYQVKSNIMTPKHWSSN